MMQEEIQKAKVIEEGGRACHREGPMVAIGKGAIV